MVSDMRKDIAKAILKNADGIIDAVDRYLAKADDDLSKALKEEGYANAEETVAAVNALEEEVADILHEQTNSVLDVLQDAEDEGADMEEVQRRISALLEADTIAEEVTETTLAMYETQVPQLASVYIKETDGDLLVNTIRNRTKSWIFNFAPAAGEWQRTATHEQILNLVKDAIENGTSIAELTRKIQEGGWRNEYYQARRYAMTETLRAHSVAHEEAIQQSPACDNKEWRHTGGSKNKPRPNHVAMDGQIVPKNEPFVLVGRDGVTYYPMYPRDSILPASETVNCHCFHRGIPNKSVLGLSYEERKKMQEDFVNADNEAWKQEQELGNQSKAGITPYSAFDSFKEKPRDKQIRYLGGKAKMALYDAGLIDSEEMLKKVKKSTLQELRECGIFTVEARTVKHSTVGEFTNLANPNKPAGGKNGGNMTGGGHSQANLEALAERGIEYRIEKTYDNGVRLGGVTNHKEPKKRLGNSGQSWFPERWDSDKVIAAGTYTSNRPAVTEDVYDQKGNLAGFMKLQEYDGVTVGVYEDVEHKIGTIFPDTEQRKVGE